MQFEADRERERQLHLRFVADRLRKSVLTGGELPEHMICVCDLADLITYVADHAPVFDPFDDWITP